MTSLLLTPTVGAQTVCRSVGCNLIANPSFEAIIGGPVGDYSGFGHPRAVAIEPLAAHEPETYVGTDPYTASKVCGWQNGNFGTADLFNVNAAAPLTLPNIPTADVRIPCNFATICAGAPPIGGQTTRTGNGYAGIIAYKVDVALSPSSEYREYIAQSVENKLTSGKLYYAEFFANISSGSELLLKNNLGMAFSSTTCLPTNNPAVCIPIGGSSAPSPALPAAVSGYVGTAPGTWQRVAGVFTATGNEKYALIGYFGPSGTYIPYSSPVIHGPGYGLVPNSKLRDMAYYFLEDVTVQAMPEAGNARNVACGFSTLLGSCALPPSSGATYSWSPTTGLSDPTSATPTFIAGSGLGNYTYTLTTTLPAPAVAPGMPALPATTHTSQVVITVTAPAIGIDASAVQVCRGSAVTLTVAGGGPHDTYTWSPATGLSSTTGPSVVATAGTGGVISYTVTSSCGGGNSINLEVMEDCCQLEILEVNGEPVIPLNTGPQYTYFSSPFNSSIPEVYYAQGDLYLEQDTYYLPPGSKLLMDANARILLANNAQLILDGATITSACGEMWGGVYVQPDAVGVFTRSSGGIRAAVEHSLKGFVLEEPSGSVGPAFAFSGTDFRQNHQSIEINRQSGTLPDDEIYDCTFDSDPAAFQSPLKDPDPHFQVYSQQHILLRGDARARAWESNLFKNAIMGIACEKPYGWMALQDNRFENCYYAGICNIIGIGAGPAQPQAKVVLIGNTFRLPDLLLTTAQLPSVVSSIGGVANTCFGAALPEQTVQALSNTFWCADAGQLYNDYDFAAQRGELQIGLQTHGLQKAIGNTFETLAVGLDAVIYAGDEVEIRGNMFLDCERGERLTPTTSATPMADPVVFNTCNTYTRDAGRGGTAYGIVVEGGSSPAPLVFDDPSNIGGGTILKDLFEDQGQGMGGFEAIHNTTGTMVTYIAFEGYASDYQLLVDAGTVDVIDSNTPVNPNGAPGNFDVPCQLELYPVPTGIQQRSTVHPTPPTIRPTPAAIGQNVPNPCVGNTSFQYQLPATTARAVLQMRRGLDGTLMQEYVLKAGTTTYELSLNGYQPGIYFYTLVVDGGPVQTKRMLVQ